MNAQQRANFEQWVADGGRVLGIHAATDTYRHSTANGSSTGTWDFYAELMGASVQENPNHVAGTPRYSMTRIGSHLSTANLPEPWVKAEEYYYWEGGYQNPGNVEVLRVEETIGPNGQVNSYDAPRPMSWCREWPGGKVFCTALGHAGREFHERCALPGAHPERTVVARAGGHRRARCLYGINPGGLADPCEGPTRHPLRSHALRGPMEAD